MNMFSNSQPISPNSYQPETESTFFLPSEARISHDVDPDIAIPIEQEVDGISLLTLTRSVSKDELIASFPKALTIYTLDFYIKGAETWERKPWGWETDYQGVHLVNIDHHSPDIAFYRSISSGTLAMTYLQHNSLVAPSEETRVAINHCDNDSITSASLLTGRIAPSDEIAAAIIAMDHTGEAHRLGDPIQALEKSRDLALSLDTLQCAVEGRELPSAASVALEEREEERFELESIIKQGTVQFEGQVAYLVSAERLPAEMLPGLLPEAALIFTAYQKDDRWIVKLRLGKAAKEGITLNDLEISDFDQEFGGRWNAGSNKRGGGSPFPPNEYAQKLCSAYQQKIKELS